MVNTIFILDNSKKTSKILTINKNSRSIFWDDTYSQDLATGAETFEFSTYADEKVVEGANVIFYYNQQYKMFTIMEIEEEHSEGQIITHCFCEISSLELINKYVRGFSGDMNCLQFFQYVLEGTGWGIGKYSSSLEGKIQTINESSPQNVWSLIQDYKDLYECEINVRVTYDNGRITGQYIDLYADGELGTPTYKRFEYGRNVSGIVKSKDLYDWATALIVDVEGVENTTFSKANGDEFEKGIGDTILDEQANLKYNGGREYVMGVYQGDKTEPREACIDAWKELQKRVVPKFNYEVTTALTSEEYENIHLGDTVYVIDHSYQPALLLEARVGELELSFTDRTQNKCTLTNYKEITSKLLSADYVKLTGQITDIVNTFFPIGPDGIQDGAIVDGKIETTYYKQITADIVSASTGAFENLYAQGLTVINADIERLNATSGEITELKAQVADIDTLVNGHLTSDNIQSMIITGDKFTVADAFIKDAMIDNITADKITTGSINTDNVYISSEDGSMIINGSLQQFKDKNGKVRIQIGKDAQDNFTFSLFDENGTGVLINEKGITENAIADGLIVDDHVAENANIDGSKLDIDSVVTEINNGTTTIKGTKVVLDESNQTLDVAFNILNTKVDDVEEEITSNTTAINVQQGQIDTLISNTTITKENGEVVQLKDEYNSTKNTVDSHATKIGSLETTVNSVSSKQASMELDLNGFRTEVSNTYATKEEVGTANYNLLSNGKFENCYKDTEDMIPSWICDKPSLKVYESQEENEFGCLALYNDSDTTKVVKQRVVLELGKTYTLTFKASWQQNVNGGIQACIDFCHNNGKFNDNAFQLESIIVPVVNNEGELQSFTFTTPVLDEYSYSEVKFIIGDAAGSNGEYVCARLGEVKLEEGDTYTGWRGSRRDEGIVVNGQNLITNGDFSSFTLPKTIDGWKVNGDGWIWSSTGQEGYNKEGCIYFAHTSIEDVYSGFYQNVYNLKKRTEYTLTFYIGWESNVRDFYADLVFWDTDGNRIATIDLKPSRAGIWSYTFVTPDIDFDRMNVGFCHRGIKEDTGGGLLGIAGNVELIERNYADNSSSINLDYVSKTEFQQTNEDFTFKIQQSGGGNLIKNSVFKNGSKYWYNLYWDGNGYNFNMYVQEAWTEWNNNKYNALTCFAEVDTPGGQINAGFDTEWIPVQPYTTYSFSCWVQCHRSKEVGFEVWYDNNDGTNAYLADSNYTLTSVGTGGSWGQNYANWTRLETTFTTPNTKRIWLRIYMGNHDNSSTLNAYLWLAQPVLVEGATPSKVWIPHESELYDGIVKIDRDGLTVQHANNKSVLDSEALNFYAGDVRYSRVKGGRFEFTNDDGSVIGDIGKSTWVGTNIGLSAVNARYGHSVALGAQRGSTEEDYTSSLILCSKDGRVSSGGGYYYEGLNISSPKVTGTMYFRGSSDDTIDIKLQGMIAYGYYGDGYRTGHLYGNEELRMGTMYGEELWNGFKIVENGTLDSKNELHAYGHLNMHNYDISNAGWVNPVSAASTYTTSLLNEGSIENMTYGGTTFTEGELRYVHRETCHTVEEWDYNDEGVWSPLGVYYCYCELPIFMAENIELDYHVNIGKIGWGDYRVIEKNPYLFIVESQEEGFAFTWEVVAKQIETATNNVVVANEYVSTERSQPIPTEDNEFTYELDKEVFIEVEEDNIQESIITGEE